MSSSRYWKRRTVRHGVIAGGSLATFLVVFLATPSPQTVFRVSMATAYTGLILAALTLLLGPLRVLRAKPSPVSFDTRRDVGIWAALFAVAHTGLGLQVHFAGQYSRYFLGEEGVIGWLPLRHDPFGLTNHAGLAVLLILIVLLIISNDVSLRRLGTRRWKFLQRWNYVAFGLLVAHGAIYQLLESRPLPYVAVFALTALTVLALQVAGVVRKRRAP